MMGLWKECSTLVVKDRTPKVNLARPLALFGCDKGARLNISLNLHQARQPPLHLHTASSARSF